MDMIIARQTLSPAESAPKQCKLLGATVKGLGVITSVSSQLFDCFVFIEDAQGKEHHAFVRDLCKAELVLPARPHAYTTTTRRISYGLWEEMHDLVVPAIDCPDCDEGFCLVNMGTPSERAVRYDRCAGVGEVEELQVAA
jgi:hypothetical protein